ncbi:MAG: hypothetical protein QNJ46_29815, partial [Leptolyngbyaceae cyanobacterium MO_188.B28]|nr:hypothetical protein [Leptolyngbyaceae cyanobacterium MO_188.B28]
DESDLSQIDIAILIQGFFFVVWLYFSVVVSITLVSSLTSPAIKLIEGYWPDWFAYIPLLGRWLNRSNRIQKIAKELEKKRQKFGRLKQKYAGSKLSSSKEIELINLDNDIEERFPPNKDHIMPTSLGNLLRAAEDYSSENYGLEINHVLPRLLLIVPDKFRKDIEESNEAIGRRIHLLIWGVFFLICSFLPYIRYDWNQAHVYFLLFYFFILIFPYMLLLIGKFRRLEKLESKESEVDIPKSLPRNHFLEIILALLCIGLLVASIQQQKIFFGFSGLLSVLVCVFNFFSTSSIPLSIKKSNNASETNKTPKRSDEGTQELNGKTNLEDSYSLLSKKAFSSAILYAFTLLPFTIKLSWTWAGLNIAIKSSVECLIIGLSIILFAYAGLNSLVMRYVQLLRYSFDFYRFKLYEDLHWPLPKDSKSEHLYGEELTRFLFRSHRRVDNVYFVYPEKWDSQPSDIRQLDLKRFRYIIGPGRKALELREKLDDILKSSELTARREVREITSFALHSLQKLEGDEYFFEVIRNYPRFIGNLPELLPSFKENSFHLMSRAYMGENWAKSLSKELQKIVEELRRVHTGLKSIFPFLSLTELQDLASRRQRVEDLKFKISVMESKLNSLHKKMYEDEFRDKDGLGLDAQKIKETIKVLCDFLGGVALVFIGCSDILVEKGLNSEFAELSILLGSILAARALPDSWLKQHAEEKKIIL